MRKKTCPLCEKEFTPWEGQKTAYWSISWCSMDSGKLCPDCYKAAEELNALFDKEPYTSQVPWGSDIVKQSKACSEQQRKEQRGSESLKHWM